MLAKVLSGTTLGLEGVPIEVEVDIASRGFPSFTIVGLPNKSIDESKDRVRTAIVNTSYDMPDSRITVNLAPADIPKDGSGFDLPIAVGILAACRLIDQHKLTNTLIIGELSLEGYVRPVPGVISLATMAKKQGYTSFFVPVENAKEAALVTGLEIIPVRTLGDMVLHFNGQQIIAPFVLDEVSDVKDELYEYDFAQIQGQMQARRAMEIAAAGFHNLHLKGPPGAGKTLLSKSLPSILPPLIKDEALEVTTIYSVSGQYHKHASQVTRPFRAPHHTTSRIGLIGGGSMPSPGEISLAHRGVLFLDEFAEFPRSVLEALRQPMEDGVVTVSRAAGTLSFPARFMLIAASNPCPCGYLGHPKRACKCMPGAIIKYRKRLSGPILDRIDLHIDVPPVEHDELTSVTNTGETSKAIRARVIEARLRQQRRFADLSISTNAEMKSSEVRALCKLNDAAIELLKQALTRLTLSARSYFKIIKVSQTIADLAGEDTISQAHIAEALQYRVKEE